MLSRPQRAALTVLGTTLGIAALVATAGLAATAGAQIVGRFDELAATQVEVVPADTGDTGSRPDGVLPWEAQARLTRLNGVVAAGTLSKLDLSGGGVRTAEMLDPLAAEGPAVEVMAASPGLLGAVRGTIGSGRWFDAGHSARADRVVVLGRNLATRLKLADVSQQPAVFVAGRPYTVIGVLAAVERKPGLLDAVILPDGLARTAFGLAAPTSVQIETRIGAADLIASQAALALAPQDPRALAVRQQPEPAATRAKVSEDVTALFLVLGALSLVIGAVGIANTTLVSVLERTGEIGLRRSIGATRTHVAAQFLLESGCIGLLGGVLGSALGTMATVGVAYVNTWTPIQDAWLAPAATGLGALVGLAAGAYPAWRAAGTAPIAALRADG